MQAVILAGGFGTRLRPLTYSLPKPLLPMIGTPMVRRLIETLPKVVDEVILTTGYRAEQLKDYFKAHDVGRSMIIVQEEKPLGTGGAIKNVERHLTDTFVVLNADVVSSLKIEDMIAYHNKKNPLTTISLFSVEDPTPFGMVNLDAEGKILSFVEKPRDEEVTSHLINAGTYVLDPEVLDHIPSGKRVSIEREVYPQLLNTERGMYGFTFSGFWTDAGTLENYLRAQRFFLGQRGLKYHIHPQAIVKGYVGENVYLGSEVRLDRGARVSNSTVLDLVQIGSHARIEGCLIGPKALIKPNVFIKDCIIGEESEVNGAHIGERYGCQ